MKLTNEIVIQKAKSIGFDLIGFAEVEKLTNEVEKLDDWLKLGYQSGMSYMERNIDKRKDVSQILPGAKSDFGIVTKKQFPVFFGSQW